MLDNSAIERSRLLLQFTRGRALDAYSGYEQIMMQLFAALIKTDLGTAGILFYRLTSSGLRTRTLEDLIERKHGDGFKTYWVGTPNKSGLFKLIRQIDDQRNHVAHWTPVYRHELGEFVLRPPNLWNSPKEYSFHSIDGLCEYKAKIDCVRHYIGKFTWRISRYQDGDSSAHALAWLDKFEHPPSYPPPEAHPLHALWQAERTRPQAFRK